ncbi:MAG TPA: serine hydrolase domain-containing protein [Bryobacteraceae bacterium]|nr:serine hydrolase domain-containing protein [Bryobacteraceae bacterium]
MKIAPACILAAVLAFAAPDQPPAPLDGRQLSASALNSRIESLMKANAVPGLGLAIIRGGTSWVHAYGVRNAKDKLPLTPDTVMYGASLTKATFAYMVMQLVDEKRIDLDRSIADYLPRPLPNYPRYADLAGDARWRRLTFRTLLDHTSGFANLRQFEPGGKLKFHYDPGTRFAYSGEGLLLAQFVLENGLHLDVGAEMQRRIFDRFGMKRTSMTWRDDRGPDVADSHLENGDILPHQHRRNVSAAGSMDTTLADWTRFLTAVVNREGLSRAAKAEMIRLQIPIGSATQFPTLSDAKTDDYKAIHLGYGLGWGVFETPFGHAFFKEGHDDGTANYALCIEPRRACILLLSNSVRAEGIFKAVVEEVMGDVHLPWKWEGYIPYDTPRAAR